MSSDPEESQLCEDNAVAGEVQGYSTWTHVASDVQSSTESQSTASASGRPLKPIDGCPFDGE